MPDMIIDGTGKRYGAAVNSKGRLQTRATAVEQRLKAAIDGDYYEMTTGALTITDANEFWPLYMLNSDQNKRVIVIDRLFIDCWESTGGVGGAMIEYYKNPTVTGGTDIVPVDCKFDDLEEPPGTFLKSCTSLTGTEWWKGYVPVGDGIVIEEGRIVLAPGRSFGVAMVPPTSNSSMVINVNIAFYYLDLAAVGEDK